MLKRFLYYGCAGWVLEVVFTGLHAAVFGHDRTATSRTYLWMHPIYGAAGLALEALAKRLRGMPWALRALAYLPVIYATEFTTGWALRRALGKCPWEYGEGFHVKGLIRLDYAPAWYMVALAFEPVAASLWLASQGPKAMYPWRRRPLLGR